MMRVIGILPARYASSRLPGKPLMDIGGKSMVQRVVEQVLTSRLLKRVVVATDDERIADHVRSFGGEAVITSADHTGGTDRCEEALRLIGIEGFDAVVNVQGDEPFIHPDQIDEVCEILKGSTGGIATLAQIVTDDRDLDDPGEVLITTDVEMNALYFSRAAIPFIHGNSSALRHSQFRFLKHVGLYAYRSEVLQALVKLAPSALEKVESLEQLRWLENGHRIRIGITEHDSFCVDTPADLEEARKRVKAAEG
ncbi:MAG: 3-deoxy-manno-octulosonate cytidylyltransferase [Bacteroidota bacterium]|nr:3-deoxy-manno-octulosonate cytidylyltransferase [Bacteroidota bacterium]